jgi:tRNA (cmo5U34)-methyltransferase
MKIPTEWTFESVESVDGFDAHVREQLPWYDLVTESIGQIAKHYIGVGGLVYDIGAATGNIGRAIRPTLAAREAGLVNIESSQPMVEHLDAHAPGIAKRARAEHYEYAPYDFAVANLTLMFIRPDCLPDMLDRLVSAMNPGGGLVVVERMMPAQGYASIVMSRLTLAAKATSGAAAEDIIAKELSLAGVQRPLDPSLMSLHGATEWFRYGDFAGWLIEKPVDRPSNNQGGDA